jgi:hypothetical protein
MNQQKELTMVWLLFVVIMGLRLTNAPLPVWGWAVLIGLMLLAGFRRWGPSQGSSSSASTSAGKPYRQDPSVDPGSPSRIRTDWSDPGFRNR